MAVKKARLRASANTVTVVGIGMSPDDLSNKALSMIEEADILIGGKRHLNCFLKLPAKKVPISKNLKPILNVITTSLKKKKKVVVIASGDPGYYGIAKYLVAQLGKEKIEIMPNITTFQAAFAKIKESWDDAFLLSLHGRPIPHLASLMRRHKKMGILTDNTNTPQKIAKSILSEDQSLKAVDVFIVEQLGMKKEKIHKYPLKSISKKSFSSLSAMILIAKTRGEKKKEENISLGIPDVHFSHQKGLITKDDVRIFTLAKLNLLKEGVFWDIGSGSGSIAVEAALLAPELEIFAIEKYKKRIEDIKKNIHKFNAGRTITPVLGEAPQILKGLPTPQRVFVGGSEGKLLPILRYCRRVLLPSGKVVINAATLETVNSAVAFFDKTGWPSMVTLLNISKMKKIGEQKRFQPLNPVFIIEGSKPEDRGKIDE
ncbi:MAG: precorrin-6y C5,15-methyltransferase (decarboxylating) subunit CbiE [Deltaproteobacteria bacterium]|nr:precorrin-6y C5,15-methyltransferase (decarboxylating) subunit CbiE [Deltaproteobacteria bacterium]